MAYAGSAYCERTRTPVPGCFARISCAARRPSSVCVGGMRMSTMATSGEYERTLSRSSSPFEAADAVVGDLDDGGAVRARDPDGDRARVRVLSHVRERLRDDVEGGGLDRRRQPLAVERRVHLDRDGRAADQGLESGLEAAVGEDRRVDAAGELAELRQRLG